MVRDVTTRAYPSEEIQSLAQRFLDGAYNPCSNEEKTAVALGLIAKAIPEDNFQGWLDLPHPYLDQRTPRWCIENGHAGAIITMIANYIEGTPP